MVVNGEDNAQLVVVNTQGYRFIEVVPTPEEDARLIQLATTEMMNVLSDVQKIRLARRMLQSAQTLGRGVSTVPWEWFDGSNINDLG